LQKKNRAKKNAKPNPFRKQNLQGIQGFIFLNTEQNRVGILGFFRGDFMFFCNPLFWGRNGPEDTARWWRNDTQNQNTPL